jgi:hypothetical protein
MRGAMKGSRSWASSSIAAMKGHNDLYTVQSLIERVDPGKYHDTLRGSSAVSQRCCEPQLFEIATQCCADTGDVGPRTEQRTSLWQPAGERPEVQDPSLGATGRDEARVVLLQGLPAVMRRALCCAQLIRCINKTSGCCMDTILPGLARRVGSRFPEHDAYSGLDGSTRHPAYLWKQERMWVHPVFVVLTTQ